jgi:hypothetical protein
LNIYGLPDYDNLGINFTDQLVSKISKLCDVCWPVVIVGDFNCPNIDWYSYSARSDQIQDQILDVMCDFGFRQLVNEPTRGSNIFSVGVKARTFKAKAKARTVNFLYK